MFQFLKTLWLNFDIKFPLELTNVKNGLLCNVSLGFFSYLFIFLSSFCYTHERKTLARESSQHLKLEACSFPTYISSQIRPFQNQCQEGRENLNAEGEGLQTYFSV